MTTTDRVAAILLTGGASRRMGHDKPQLVIEGTTLARRTGALLRLVTEAAVEVGPGHSGLVATLEEPAGNGPLAAIAAGRRRLREMGSVGAALVVACDLPFLSEKLLRFLADCDAPGTVLPVVEGHVQPLCARWSPRDLDAASELVARGVRSLQHLNVLSDVTLLKESDWENVASAETFRDVDSPEDLARYGLS